MVGVKPNIDSRYLGVKADIPEISPKSKAFANETSRKAGFFKRTKINFGRSFMLKNLEYFIVNVMNKNRIKFDSKYN